MFGKVCCVVNVCFDNDVFSYIIYPITYSFCFLLLLLLLQNPQNSTTQQQKELGPPRSGLFAVVEHFVGHRNAH
jgi:hypothetical protein